MASSTPLKDIEENFFLCSVCLDQFKEPKQLPCLHRYCTDCLKSVIQSTQDKTFKCPMCKEVYVKPENGVDDFKTDFHMKNVIEFIELQKSLEKKEVKNCIDCSKKTAITAYCFKCNHFLCDPCHQRHLHNPRWNDHQAHIIKFENIEAKNLTLEKLAALTEDPRYHSHIKQPAQLCCITCGNIPVSMVCVYGKHKVHDVTEIAKSERKSLHLILDELNLHKSQLYEFPEKVKTAKRNLKDNLSKETAKWRIQYEEQVYEIKTNLEVNNAEQKRHDRDIKYRRNDDEKKIASNREKEIKLVRKKYYKIINTVRKQYDEESNQVKKAHDKIEKELGLKLNSLEGNLKNNATAQELLAKHNENELQKLLDHCKQIVKRYENFLATTSSILATKDEWIDAQCIPDIRAASEPLFEEMKKTFTELESLSDLDIGGVDDVSILKLHESVVVVEGFKVKKWFTGGITSSRDGSIVLTDTSFDNHTHITVINRQGEILRQDKMKAKFDYVRRNCCFISDFKVATVCEDDEIGIYDVHDGSYKKRITSDFLNTFSCAMNVRCVAFDPASNHIIVGTDSRDVYVFDHQLNYSHTMRLPYEINETKDITLHEGSLVICDDEGKRAYAVTMEGSESKLMYEFIKPDLIDGYEWVPWSVCTYKNRFIFMLWAACSWSQRRCVLVQYSQDGRQLLTTRPIDKDAGCVTTLEVDNVETIMIATMTSGKLYTYGV